MDTDLELIEEALKGGRASASDPRERELQELALALQADSPAPAPEFAEELDQQVEEGFGRADGPRWRLGFALPGRIRGGLLPALGVACVLVAVVAVAVGVLSGGSEEQAPLQAKSEPEQTSTIPEDADALRLGPSAGAATIAPSPAPSAAAESRRKVERSAQLTLAATEGKMQSVADGVGVVAERHGGYVLRSQVTTGDAGAAGGSFTLRVPSDRLEVALADLSKLGKVTARSETGQDLTATARRTERKLGELLIERRALRDKLRAADTEDEQASLRSKLRLVSAQVDDLNDRMQQIERRTVYSTVSVTLEQRKDDGAGAGGKGSDSTGDALRDALDTLVDVVNFLVRALGVLIPLGLLAALAAVAVRVLRRRRREAALF